MELARTKRTGHPLIAALSLAQIINRRSGGTVIAPWEITELPEEWIDVFLAMEMDLPLMQQAQKTVDDKFAQFRNNHPTYRKYGKQ